MKKYLIIVCLCFSFGSIVQAQVMDSRDIVSFGVKAGLNVANVWDAEGQDFQADAKAGFAGGVFLGLPIGPILGFQPEVLLSQKGFSASGTLFGSDYSIKRTTTYIDLPLQLQVKPAEFVTILVGPQYSFLLHQRDAYVWGASSVVQEQEFNNDKIRKNIFGIVAGADFSVSHFVFAPRMGWDLLNNNGDGTSTTPRYKNRWIQLTAGVKF